MGSTPSRSRAAPPGPGRGDGRRRAGPVTPVRQLAGEEIPAPGAVPGAVDESETGHAPPPSRRSTAGCGILTRPPLRGLPGAPRRGPRPGRCPRGGRSGPRRRRRRGAGPSRLRLHPMARYRRLPPGEDGRLGGEVPKVLPRLPDSPPRRRSPEDGGLHGRRAGELDPAVGERHGAPVEVGAQRFGGEPVERGTGGVRRLHLLPGRPHRPPPAVQHHHRVVLGGRHLGQRPGDRLAQHHPPDSAGLQAVEVDGHAAASDPPTATTSSKPNRSRTAATSAAIRS